VLEGKGIRTRRDADDVGPCVRSVSIHSLTIRNQPEGFCP
jgi:hypothetical protein